MFYSNDADNLGNHTATTHINVSNKQLLSVSGILFSGLNGLIYRASTGLAFYNLGGDILYIGSSGNIGLGQTPPLDANSNYVLVWSSGSKAVSYRTASGLMGGGGGGGTGTIAIDLVGAGTHADPVTERNIVYTVSGVDTTLDARSVVHWTQGQAGSLIADGTMANQPRFIVPSGYQIELCQVIATLGKAGSTDTTLQITITNDGGGTAPVPGSPNSTLTMSSGVVNSVWSGLSGTTLNSLQHVQTRVDVAGSDAESLTIQFWGKTTACG